MKKIVTAAFFCLALVCCASGAELVKDGKAACRIVVTPGQSPVIRHAAEELALYLNKITGGANVQVAEAPVSGLNMVLFERSADPKMEDDGFALSSEKNVLKIQAKTDPGFLYGAYEILKRYGNVRWLVPGPEGEFVRNSPSVSVPSGRTLHNPSFKVRTFHFNCANIDSPKLEVLDWMLRNNMVIEETSDFFRVGPVSGFIKNRPYSIREGWHCFTRLHNGEKTAPDRAKWAADYRKMFEEHPERFPLINGKRQFLEGQKFQPCTTNPDNIRIMASNLIAHLKKSGITQFGGRYILVNNDNTNWCECENCKAADDPREAKEHQISTRYWKFINALSAGVRKELPDAPLVGYAYQNYQAPPLGVNPDPKMAVMLSFNRICYRHRLDDPECPTNKVFLRCFQAWSKVNGNVYTWEEIGPNGTCYMPLETTFVDHLKTYRKLGMAGTIPSIAPLFAKYEKRYQDTLIPESWYGMWQALYLSAQFHWNMDSDYARLLEEANQLFYGKAWDAGMKEFRELIGKTASSTPGCFGWGHGAPVGRCLTQPGVHKKLLECLDRAGAAVQNDPRSLKNVRRDRMFFAKAWEKEYTSYLKNFRDLRIYAKTAPIQIDGNIDEPDWKNADIISNFKIDSEKPARNQTFVRTVYEPDAIYFAVELMEPSPGKMESKARERDGKLWEDNSFEIFLNHPDMGNSYYHFIINDRGSLYDSKVASLTEQDVSFHSGAEVKTKVLNDRWCAEIRIPTAMLGMKCFDGHTWRVNMQRYRVVKGEQPESSSIASGAGHNVESFLPLAFAGKRQTADVSFSEIDTRFWKNADCNEVEKQEKLPGSWTSENHLLPKNWFLNLNSGSIAMKKHPGSDSNYYIELTDGIIYQYHRGRNEKYAIRFRAAGEGTLSLYAYRYQQPEKVTEGLKHLGSDFVAKASPGGGEWKDYKFEYTKKDPAEAIGAAFHVKGKLLLDDIYVYPVK